MTPEGFYKNRILVLSSSYALENGESCGIPTCSLFALSRSEMYYEIVFVLWDFGSNPSLIIDVNSGYSSPSLSNPSLS